MVDMNKNQIVHNHFSELGKKSAEVRSAKYGPDYMASLSKRGVEARRLNAVKRALVINLDNSERNCEVCGADHAQINDDNRQTYAKAHKKYLEGIKT